MLRDRLICRVNHKGITNRLLAEKDLTFDKALKLAQAMESAERDTQHLQSMQQQPQDVHHSAVPQKDPQESVSSPRRPADAVLQVWRKPPTYEMQI